MRIVFWTNCVSPHQMPYISKLIDFPEVDDVIVVAETSISKNRRDQGWQEFSSEGIDIKVNPRKYEIEKLLSTNIKDSWHLFSGIRAFPFVKRALTKSLKYPVKRAVISERPNTFYAGFAHGKPLWLHRIRFFIFDRKLAVHIHKFFAIGEEAVQYFNSLNMKWATYPFAYCTDSTRSHNSAPSSPKTNFIFIGSLEWWKSPISLVQALPNSCHCRLTIVGEGSERKRIEHYLKEQAPPIDVNFTGRKPISEIPQIITEQDVLVLPSIYDGWGAVVNEALENGCFVICSSACGAKDLLRDSRLGMVFQAGDKNDLRRCMNYGITHIETIRANKAYRQQWAERCISGKSIARYMIDALLEKDNVTPPWH